MNDDFSEIDLENIFAGKKKKKSRKSLYILYSILTISFFVIIYITMNAPSIGTRVDYWYETDFAPTQKDDSKSPSNSSSSNSTSISDNTIKIDRIGIAAPITWDVVNSANVTAKALENGTIHLAGTAHPGEIGNVFITGHSSNYLWAPGKYKTVFAILNNIVVGDRIYLKYQNKQFSYKVTGTRVVKPTDLSVLAQGKDSILSVVTCTPVGTSINRLVVTAQQVSPDPAFNKKNSNLKNNSSLPGIR